MTTMMITSSIFILMFLLLRGIFQKKISKRLQYALWIFVVVKLLIFPVPYIESNWSIMNLFDEVEENRISVGNEVFFQNVRGESGDQNTQNQQSQNQVSQELGQENSISENFVLENEQLQKEESGIEISTIDFSRIDFRKVGIVIWVLGSLTVISYIVFVNARLGHALRKNRILFDYTDSQIPVYLLEKLPTPCLYGRAIYIPMEIAVQEQKRNHVLIHETVHYKHGDGFWGMVRGLCITFYWWNPLVWLAAYLSMLDCEYACDEAVVLQMGKQERISYSETILSLVKVKKSSYTYFFLASTLTGGGKKMKKRILQITNRTKSILMVAVLVVCLLMIGLVATITDHQPDKNSQEASTNNNPEKEEAISLQKEFELMLKEQKDYKLLVEDISLEDKVINKYSLYTKSESIYADGRVEISTWWDGELQYNEAIEKGIISAIELPLSEECKIYKNTNFATEEQKKQEITLEEFAELLQEGARECEIKWSEGEMNQILIVEPYMGLSFSPAISENFLRQQSGVEGNYTEVMAIERNINHDEDSSTPENSNEKIVFCKGTVGEKKSAMIKVVTEANNDYCIEVTETKSGWKEVYGNEIEGKYFFIAIKKEIEEDVERLTYHVYSLGEQVGEELATYTLSGATYEYTKDTYDPEIYILWEEALALYLENSTRFASTKAGYLDTAHVEYCYK